MRRLTQLALGHSRTVVVCAVLIFAGALAVSVPALDRLQPFSSEDPTSESVEARQALERATGIDPRYGIDILVGLHAAPQTASSRKRLRSIGRLIMAEPAVRYASFKDDEVQLSRDGRLALVTVGLRPGDVHAQLDTARDLKDRFADDPDVTVGGIATFYAEGNDIALADLARVELIAFPLLFLLLLRVFRGVFAALIPLVVGGLAIACSLFVLRIVNEFTDVSIYALNISSALGLGLAIDYSLLVLSRFREERARTGRAAAAVESTLSMAGRTVCFSAVIVVGSLASLLVFPQNFLYSIGLAGMIVTAVSAIGALVLLPSLVVLLGERVDALALSRLRSGRSGEGSSRQGGWYRFSRWVMRWPGMIAATTGVALIVIGLPALRLAPTQIEERVMPKTSSARQVAEAIDKRFQPNIDSPVYVVLPERTDRGDARRARERLLALEGAATVLRPEALQGGGWRVDVIPNTAPLSAGGQSLVTRVRTSVADAHGLVGGEAASLVDLKAGLAARIPIAMALIVLVTLVALFLMTGSVLLPIKAVLMNLLTIVATLGVMVLVFQDGRFEKLLGYTSMGALEASQLMMLFAIAFGLSTDYGVFLVSRIKEARDRGADDSEAVAIGLERTGRVVTAAALLLCVALGALIAAEHASVKEVGFGVALAVAIDASVVRALLVPSLMVLLGRWNWWAPRPLRRLHSRYGWHEG